MPFEVPEDWRWCRLNDIAKLGTGATPLTSNSSYYVNGTIPWINSSATSNTFITSASAYITEKAIAETNCTIYPIGTLLVAMYGEGKTRGQISELKIEAATNQACAAIQLYLKEKALIDYVKYCFQNNYEMLRSESKGGNQPNLNTTIISNFYIPLPPLSEICRILVFIESAFTLIDQIEENKLSLSQFIKQTKSKVLDLAIRGKLVPQDPNDEPASVLLEKIKTKSASDILHYPFEVPKNWTWCRLGEIFQITMGQSPDGNSVTHDSQGIEFHQGKLCFTEKYIEKSIFYTNNPTKIAEANSALLCVRAPVGVINITPRKICIGRGLCAIKVPEKMDILFAFYWFKTLENSFNQKATGSTFTAISGDIIKNELIPLPPLSEQQRIVQKIESIFKTLDSIQNNI